MRCANADLPFIDANIYRSEALFHILELLHHSQKFLSDDNKRAHDAHQHPRDCQQHPEVEFHLTKFPTINRSCFTKFSLETNKGCLNAITTGEPDRDDAAAPGLDLTDDRPGQKHAFSTKSVTLSSHSTDRATANPQPASFLRSRNT